MPQLPAGVKRMSISVVKTSMETEMWSEGAFICSVSRKNEASSWEWSVSHPQLTRNYSGYAQTKRSAKSYLAEYIITLKKKLGEKI